MQNKQLYLNGHEVDLGTDSPPAITFQVATFNNVQSVQGSGSNTFKIPLTQNTRRVLGFPDDISADPVTPYEKVPAKYVEDGLEIIPNGYALLLNVENNDLNIQVLTGNSDFMTQLGGQLYDMGDVTSEWSSPQAKLYLPQTAKEIAAAPNLWTPYDHQWNVENPANSQNNTEGWIWPLVDYGEISFDPGQAQLKMDVQKMRPGFFLKTALELMVATTTYQIDKAGSCLYNDPYYANLYNKLIVQFANGSLEHGTTYQNTPDDLSMSVSTNQNRTLNQNDKPTKVVFDITGSDPSGKFNVTDHGYLATENVQVDVQFTFGCRLMGSPRGSTPSSVMFEVLVYDPGTGQEVSRAGQPVDFTAPVADQPGNPFTGYHQDFYNQTLSCSTDIPKGGYLCILYTFKNVNNASAILFAGANLKVVTNHQAVLYGQMIQCERILPGINQGDFLKDTLQRFGLICQTDANEGTVRFSSLRDIIARAPYAKDWTDKITLPGRTLNFSLGDNSNYFQYNTLEYQQDDSNTRYMGLKYGWDTIKVPNKALDVQGTLVQSIFGVSLNTLTYGGYTAQLSTYGQASFSTPQSARLLIDNKVQLGALPLNADGTAKTVLFSDDPDHRSNQFKDVTISDVACMPYFWKPGGDYSLMWCDMVGQKGLKSLYYGEIEQLLQYPKKLTLMLMLKPADIYQLDLLTPVYLGQPYNAYFYISKISNWMKNAPTQVDLIKLY